MKLETLVAVPPGLITVTGPVFAPFGTVAVIVVGDIVVNIALEPLNLTALASVKFVPVIVTIKPRVPLLGENSEIVGAGMTVKLVAPVAVPPGVVTVIGPVVAALGTVATI